MDYRRTTMCRLLPEMHNPRTEFLSNLCSPSKPGLRRPLLLVRAYAPTRCLLDRGPLLMEEHTVELVALEEAHQADITTGSLMASRARSVPHRKAHRIRGCEAIKELLNNLRMAPRLLHLARARCLLDSGRR